MKQAFVRSLAVVALLSSALVSTECGGSDSSPAAPSSPGASGGGSNAGGGTTVPPSSGNSLQLSPSSIQGQGQPQGLVTLANAAPSGGALVSLSTSNPSIAKVPPTVTIAAGSRSAAFLVDTSSVAVATTVTISASYAGVLMSSTLTVTSTPLNASFTVTSPEHGPGTCGLQESTSELDCLLDGSSSTGNIATWIWSYTAGTNTLGHRSSDFGSKPQIGSKCAFLNTASGGDDAAGDKWLKLEISLQVEDRAGARSGIVRQQVKLYPNKRCGFNY